VPAAVQDISIANSMNSVKPGAAVPNPEGIQKACPRTLSAIEQVILL
jgi:hypothetical protein